MENFPKPRADPLHTNRQIYPMLNALNTSLWGAGAPVIPQFWPSIRTRATAACSKPKYQSGVSIMIAADIPRYTVNV